MSEMSSFTGKLKAIASLGLVFLLVIATNMMDKHHFEVVKNTLETVYEDRLVAKNYLFKMSEQLNRKQLALLKEESERITQVNTMANDSIQNLMDLYGSTKLTQREASLFEALQSDLAELFQLEGDWEQEGGGFHAEADTHYQQIETTLAELTEIQLVEGKRQIDFSNRAIASSDLISNIEIGVLIAIGLIVQIIIIYRPIIKPSRKGRT